MTTTTTLAQGSSLSRDVHLSGWNDFLNGGDYTEDQNLALCHALLAEQCAEFEDLLPEGCSWIPATSSIVGPVDTDLAESYDDPDSYDPLTELMTKACEAVIARVDEIEKELGL